MSGDQLDDGESETMDELVSEKCACPSKFTGRCCQKRFSLLRLRLIDYLSHNFFRKEIPTCPEKKNLKGLDFSSYGCADDQDCQGNKTCCRTYFGFPVCIDPKLEGKEKTIDI